MMNSAIKIRLNSSNTGAIVAFFCSSSCPGDIILMAQDWARNGYEKSIPVISGFHTSVEKEVLRLLLRNRTPIVYVVGRSIEGWRKPREISRAIESGSLTAISTFPKTQRRTTAKSAETRNRYIVSKANSVLVAHASASGKTEALARSVLEQGKKLFTFASPSNSHLIEMGATPIRPEVTWEQTIIEGAANG